MDSIRFKQVLLMLVLISSLTRLDAQKKLNGWVFYSPDDSKKEKSIPVAGAFIKLTYLGSEFYSSTNENGYFSFEEIHESTHIQILVRKKGMLIEKRSFYPNETDSLIFFLHAEKVLGVTPPLEKLKSDLSLFQPQFSIEAESKSDPESIILSIQSEEDVVTKNNNDFGIQGVEAIDEKIVTIENKKNKIKEKQTELNARVKGFIANQLTTIRLLQADGKYEKAEGVFKEIILLDPGNTIVLDSYFAHLLQRGNLKKAKAMNGDLLRNSRTTKDSTRHLFNQGLLLSQSKQPFEAIRFFEECINLASQQNRNSLTDQDLYLPLLHLADSYQKQDMHIESFQCYSKLLAAHEKNNFPESELPKLFYQLGDLYLKMEEEENALRNFEKSLILINQVNPLNSKQDSMHVLSSIGKLKDSNRDTKEALNNYELALELASELSERNPTLYERDYLDIALQLGYIYIEAGEIQYAAQIHDLIKDKIEASEFSNSEAYKKISAASIIQACKIKGLEKRTMNFNTLDSVERSEYYEKYISELDKALLLLNQCALDLEIHTLKEKAKELKEIFTGLR